MRNHKLRRKESIFLKEKMQGRTKITNYTKITTCEICAAY